MGAEYNVVDTEYFILFKEKRLELVQKRIHNLISGLANASINSTQVSNSDLRKLQSYLSFSLILLRILFIMDAPMIIITIPNKIVRIESQKIMIKAIIAITVKPIAHIDWSINALYNIYKHTKISITIVHII